MKVFLDIDIKNKIMLNYFVFLFTILIIKLKIVNNSFFYHSHLLSYVEK